MTTGPEHYREAEKRLAWAAEQGAQSPETEAAHLAYAQVHATLAVAAAIGGLDAVEGPGGGSATGRVAEDGNAWLTLVARPDGES